MPLFSVIVPIYNTPAEYLRACINSSVCQNLDDIEVILVDDGSEKYCREICEEYAKSNPTIKYLRQEKKGVSVARNVGLMNSTGEYVVFLDSDDRIPAGFLAEISNKITEHGRPDILMYGYGSEYRNRNLNRRLSYKKSLKLERDNLIYALVGEYNGFLPYDVSNIWAKLIKRSMIENYGISFPDGIIKGEDAIFMMYVYYYSEKISYEPAIGYYYRKNDRSVTHRFNPRIMEIDENQYSTFESFLTLKGYDTSEIINNLRVKALLDDYLNLYFCHKDNPKDRRQLKKEYIELIRSEKNEEAIRNTSINGGMMGLKVKALRSENISLIWMLKKIDQMLRRALTKEYD